MIFRQDSIQLSIPESSNISRQTKNDLADPILKRSYDNNRTNYQAINNVNNKTVHIVQIEQQQYEDTVQYNHENNSAYKPFSLFSTLKETDSSIVQFQSEFPKFFKTHENKDLLGGANQINPNISYEKSWIMGIAIFSLILLLIIKMYFQKYLSSVIASIVNIQIAEKLMREKNVIIRRVFSLLNLNFAISVGLFLYILFNRLNIRILEYNNFITFSILFIAAISILILRYLLILIIGSTFNSFRLIKEYLHNTYLINKNLGLYLLPVTISIFFLNAPLNDLAFILSLGFISLSIIYKYIRGLQILMKHKVFLFYSILYLCSLEIIPALVGLRFVLSLR